MNKYRITYTRNHHTLDVDVIQEGDKQALKVMLAMIKEGAKLHSFANLGPDVSLGLFAHDLSDAEIVYQINHAEDPSRAALQYLRAVVEANRGIDPFLTDFAQENTPNGWLTTIKYLQSIGSKFDVDWFSHLARDEYESTED